MHNNLSDSVSCLDGSVRQSKQPGCVIDPYTTAHSGGPLTFRQLQRGSEMEAALSSALVKLL